MSCSTQAYAMYLDQLKHIPDIPKVGVGISGGSRGVPGHHPKARQSRLLVSRQPLFRFLCGDYSLFIIAF